MSGSDAELDVLASSILVGGACTPDAVKLLARGYLDVRTERDWARDKIATAHRIVTILARQKVSDADLAEALEYLSEADGGGQLLPWPKYPP